MFSLFLLLLVPEAFVASSTPTPCCVIHKFMANLYGFGGSVQPGVGGVPIDVNVKMYYDYDNQMMKTEPLDGDDGVVSITDYRKKMRYVIGDGMCRRYQENGTLPYPCMLTNSTFTGSYLLGGNSKVRINSWRGEVNLTANDQYRWKVSVTEDHCIPVAYSMYGTIAGALSEVSYFFTDFTEGALATGVFDVPVECMHGTNIGGAIGKRTLPFEFPA